MIESLILGVSIYTLHGAAEVDCTPCKLRNNTPGLYVRSDDYTLGSVRNSYGRWSWYAGRTWHAGGLDFTVGAITGYQYRTQAGACGKYHRPCQVVNGETNAVLRPLVAASYVFGTGPVRPRLSLLGKGLHLSVEFTQAGVTR